MASLNNARTIFAFTSPRTIEKIIPEIGILVDNFSGQKWSKEIQIEFFDNLFASEYYEGRERPDDPSFAARDRITRAPKALGFVDLKPTIELTEVGKQLLSGRRTNEVIARQLFKFQLPSPYHKIPEVRNFNVRPYLELLRTIKTIGNISKTEIAIFFVQLTNYQDFDNIITAIRKYREDYRAHVGNKKIFTDNIFSEEVRKIYAEEIRNEDFKGRQDNDSTEQALVERKKANQYDYADALIRYLRATQLISFDKNFRVIVSPARVAEVDYVLETVERDAFLYANEREFKDYLFNPSSLTLFTDLKINIHSRFDAIGIPYNKSAEIEELKDLLEEGEINRISQKIRETEIGLKHYKEFDDVEDVFSKIHEKIMPDPSLYLEWNVWRAMVMMNFAQRVQGNFKLALDGLPLNTAGARLPDIEVDYDGFKLIVEVTMSSGQKQYDMEGEPVPRHFGVIKNATELPVYCLFIAPKISDGTLAHYFALNQKAPKFYGSQTNIIPMSVQNFRTFITTARDHKFNDPNQLKDYFDNILAENRKLDDESIWLSRIQDSVTNWL